jgi:hypothetical protein
MNTYSNNYLFFDRFEHSHFGTCHGITGKIFISHFSPPKPSGVIEIMLQERSEISSFAICVTFQMKGTL